MLACTWKSFRWSLGMLLMVGIGAIATISARLDPAIADQPLQVLEPPRFDPTKIPPENDAVKVKIRQALENPERAKTTGDVVLDGFMDVIRQQGSLVDRRLPEFPEFLQASEPPSEQHYLLAEQLLMTARLLSHDPSQGERRQLIRLLRQEAARCLNTRTISPPPHHTHAVPALAPPKTESGPE